MPRLEYFLIIRIVSTFVCVISNCILLLIRTFSEIFLILLASFFLFFTFLFFLSVLLSFSRSFSFMEVIISTFSQLRREFTYDYCAPTRKRRKLPTKNMLPVVAEACEETYYINIECTTVCLCVYAQTYYTNVIKWREKRP